MTFRRIRNGQKVRKGATNLEQLLIREFGSVLFQVLKRLVGRGRICAAGPLFAPRSSQGSHIFHLLVHWFSVVLSDNVSQQRSHDANIGSQLRIGSVASIGIAQSGSIFQRRASKEGWIGFCDTGKGASGG
jgi:hypothetical protein